MLFPDPIVQFTVLVAAALVVQLTLERLHLPGIVGLLVIGTLIGPGGLELLPREPVVGLLGSVGLVYIMFLAGLEIDLDTVREYKHHAASFGLLAFVLSFVPAVGVGLLIGLAWPGAVLLGAALASHTLLAYPIVERMGLVTRRSVVTAVGGTLITDTLALLLLAVTIQVAAAGETVTRAALPLVLFAALVVAALLLVPRLGRAFLREGGAQPAVQALFVLAVMLVLSSSAELVGMEDILGAFLAGLCLNRLIHTQQVLHEHVEFVGRMLFIPFFFVDTGMRLELEVFTGRAATWGLAGVLLLVVLAGKAAAAWLTALRYGYSRAAAGVMAGLTIPQAAATLAVTVTAAEAGLLGEDLVDAIIIVIFFSCLIGPLLTRWSGERLKESSDATHERLARDRPRQ